jgi:hypothetical protein
MLIVSTWIVIGSSPLIVRWINRQLIFDQAVRIEIASRRSLVVMTYNQERRGLSVVPMFLLRLEDRRVVAPLATPLARDGAGIRDAAEISSAVRTLGRRLFLFPFLGPIVPMYVDADIAGACWEAPLMLPLTGRGRAMSARVSLVRAAGLRHTTDQPRTDSRVGVIGGVGTIMPAWRNAVHLTPPLDRSDMPSILHIVARPRATRSGTVLTIAGPKGTKTVTPTSLAVDVPNLIVLQEEPIERLHRLDVDRAQTANARAWASAAFEFGAAAVLFLPAMPTPIATAAVKSLTRALHGRMSPSLWTHVNAAVLARASIATFSLPKVDEDHTDIRGGLDDTAAAAALNELGVEVTLFVRSTHFGRRDRHTDYARLAAT